MSARVVAIMLACCFVSFAAGWILAWWAEPCVNTPSKPPKPDPMVCPACGEATDWIWDDDLLPSDPPDYQPQPEWAIDGEWWHDPEHGIPYADTYYCLGKLQRADAS